jgi:twitching motility protein PilT
MDSIAQAKDAGFEVLLSPKEVQLDEVARRILPSDQKALGISLAGDVLEVLLDHIPSPAEYAELEKTAGMLIAVTITTKEIFQEIFDLANKIADDAPRVIGPALASAVELDASDLHLSVGTPPIVRVGGDLKPLENWGPLSNGDLKAAAEWVLGTKAIELENNDTIDYDGAITYRGRRWRVNLYKQRASLALSMRLIPTKPPRLEELGLPLAVADLSKLTSGLVLFAGPTGSGKSTSMAALIDRINKERRCHILTIEDPIEYQHNNQKSIVHQREVGHDTATFALGLRAALRQDPDVILVGELRDVETMATALHAAETGHLVLATVHASSADSVVTRLVSSFPAGEQDQILTQLASSLQAIVCQVLLPTIDRSSHRALASEVLIVTTPARTMIREKRLHEVAAMLDSNSAQGMISLEKSLANLVSTNRVNVDEAERHANDVKLFNEYLVKYGDTQKYDFDSFDSFGELN